MALVKFPSGTSGAVALGAGLASAVLYLVARKTSVPAVMLAQLGPLPIMIATLGFGGVTGLLAALFGCLTVLGNAVSANGPARIGFYAAGLDAIFYVALQAAPALWLGQVARQRRREAEQSGPWTPSTAPRRRPVPTASRVVVSSPENVRLFKWVMTSGLVIAVGGVLAVVAANAWQAGSYDEMVSRLAGRIEPLVRDLLGTERETLGGFDVHDLAVLMARAAWPAVAGISFFVLMGNLWLAGRIVQISDRLRRPWPDVPRDLRVPGPFALLLAAALGACFAGGEIAALAAIVAAVLGCAFALQGLAVLHDLTRGSAARVPLLATSYLLLALTVPWPLAVFAIVGLADAGFGLRDRKAGRLAQKQN